MEMGEECVVGVRSQWVGGGDPPPRKLKCVECWMVDWYLRWVDDRMVRSLLCAWMIEYVATTTATLHRTCLRHIPISAAPHDVIVRE